MSNKKTSNPKVSFANFFGSAGYFFVFLQVFVLAVAYFEWLRHAMDIVAPPQPVEPAPPVEPIPVGFIPPEPSILTAIFTVVVTIICIAIVLYLIIKAPISISRASSKVVRTAANKAAPAVLQLQKKRVTKKKRLQLSFSLVLILKLTAIVLLLLLTYLAQFFVEPLVPFQYIIGTGVFMAAVSLLFFGVQYTLVTTLKLDKTLIK